MTFRGAGSRHTSLGAASNQSFKSFRPQGSPSPIRDGRTNRHTRPPPIPIGVDGVIGLYHENATAHWITWTTHGYDNAAGDFSTRISVSELVKIANSLKTPTLPAAAAQS